MSDDDNSYLEHLDSEPPPLRPYSPPPPLREDITDVPVTSVPVEPLRKGSSWSFDWNEKFQLLLERRVESPSHELHRAAELRKLCTEFAEQVKRMTIIIVNELFVPEHKKTLPPITSTIGGLAGGEKFLHDGILYKLAVDFAGIYGGDQYASKAAQHELKGLMAYLDCRIQGLHFPLCAGHVTHGVRHSLVCVVVEYLGYTVEGQSVVPIDESTLRYGSADGGDNVFTSDPILNAKMEMAAKILNLKGHYVDGKRGNEKHLLFAPADIEGHLGRDGRYYILDTARVFPPVQKTKRAKGSHLYNLFRQEFLTLNPVPLCSDSFSKFGAANAQENHREINEATRKLEYELIPNFAKELLINASTTDEPRESFMENSTSREEVAQLIADMHLRGINIRYLMILFHHLSSSTHLQTLVATEMCARVAKVELKERWRNLHHKIRKEKHCKQIVADYFNLLFDKSPKSREYKEGKLGELIATKFLMEEGKVAEFSVVDRVHWNLLLERVQEISGVRLRWKEIEASSQGDFTCDHVDTIQPTAKYFHRVSFEEGTALSRMAMNKTGQLAIRLFQLAGDKYRDCLTIKPNNERALYNWGLSLSKQALLTLPNSPTEAAELFRLAEEKYRRALTLDPHGCKARSRWGTSALELAKAYFAAGFKPDAIHLVCRACSKLLEACSAENTNFEAVYNCGNAHLWLATINLTDMREKRSPRSAHMWAMDEDRVQTGKLLDIACEYFQIALSMRPNSVEVLCNLAISLAKKARTTDQHHLFDQASQLYSQAISLMPTQDGNRMLHDSRALVYFDWGNALYRKAIAVSSATHKVVELLQQASHKYQQCIEVKADLIEAYTNWTNVVRWMQSLPQISSSDLNKNLLHFVQAVELACKENYLPPTHVPMAIIRNLLNYEDNAISDACARISSRWQDADKAQSKESQVPLMPFDSFKNHWTIVSSLPSNNHVGELFLVRQKTTGMEFTLQIVPSGAIGHSKQLFQNLKFPSLQTLSYVYYDSQEERYHFVFYGVYSVDLLSVARKLNDQRTLVTTLWIAELVLTLRYLCDNGILLTQLTIRELAVNNEGHLMLKNNYRFVKSSEYKSHESHSWEHHLLVCPEMLKRGVFTEKSLCWLLGTVVFEILTNCIPFHCASIQGTLNKILNEEIDFPADMKPAERSLVSLLLVANPDERIALDRVCSHEFFASVDWELVQSQQCNLPQTVKDTIQELHTSSQQQKTSAFVPEQPIDTLIAPEVNNKLEGFSFISERSSSIRN